jgi:putative ABC transport system permease protein
MLRLSLRSLAAKKFRLISTALAIVIGVGFTVGTLILSDTMDRSFSTAIDDITAGVDTLVRGEEPVDTGPGAPSQRTQVDVELLETVRAVDGVAAVAPYQEGQAQILDRSGKVIDVPQTVGLNWVDDDEMATFELVDGTPPRSAGEIVLDERAAEEADASLGDQVEVISAKGTETFELAGTARLAGGSRLSSTAFVFFSDEDAAERLSPPGTVDAISVRAAEGVSESVITGRVAAAIADAPVEAISGTDYRREQKEQLGSVTGTFRTVLLVFAGIALLVGSFTIANTFTITVAQRTRELALVRAIGGSRRQIIGLVLVEALVLGVVASAAGIAVGIGMARGLLAVLAGIGLEIPATNVKASGGVVVSGMVTGIAVTVLAAISATRRAASVAPVAAMREGLADRSGTSGRRPAIGSGLSIVAAAAITMGLAQDATALVGLGTAAAFAAALVLGPTIVRPAMALLGWPLRRLGATGRLAAANAARNPKRTASTAAALTIGVMLVAGASMFAATAKETIRGDIDDVIVADQVIRPTGSSQGLPETVAIEATDVPGASVLPIRDGYASIDGGVQPITGVDLAAADGKLELRAVEGTLSGAPGTISVSADLAATEGWEIGDAIDVQFASGTQVNAELAGTFDQTTAVAEVVVHYETMVDAAPDPFDSLLLVTGSAESLQEVDASIADVPTATMGTVEDLAASRAGTLDVVLSIVIGFLALAVIIAVLGIGTTISLSVRERTRELGVLRSIGMTRVQVRRTVRCEAVSIALLGTALGAALGLGCTWALLQTLRGSGFAAPVIPAGALITVAIGAVLAGIIAAAMPARRAARLAILDAVRTA